MVSGLAVLVNVMLPLARVVGVEAVHRVIAVQLRPAHRTRPSAGCPAWMEPCSAPSLAMPAVPVKLTLPAVLMLPVLKVTVWPAVAVMFPDVLSTSLFTRMSLPPPTPNSVIVPVPPSRSGSASAYCPCSESPCRCHW